MWAKVITYCMDDVALTRDLLVFSERYGFLRNDKGVKVLPVEWENGRIRELASDG